MHMFNDGGYVMGGMHCFWWIFWILAILSYFGNSRPARRKGLDDLITGYRTVFLTIGQFQSNSLE